MDDPVSTPKAVRAMVRALEVMLDVDTEDDGALATALEVVEVALAAWRSRIKLADDNAFGEYFDREVLTLLDARLSGEG